MGAGMMWNLSGVIGGTVVSAGSIERSFVIATSNS
jgi:hypothetical protein